MNLYLFMLLVGFLSINVSKATQEDEWSLLFAQSGDSTLAPEETQELLQRLGDEYGKKKKEVDTLIAVSDITEERCRQNYVDHINRLLEKYSNRPNLVPYLKHYKASLIAKCFDQFNLIVMDLPLEHKDEYDNERKERKKLTQADQDWLRRNRQVLVEGAEAGKEPKEFYLVLKTLYQDLDRTSKKFPGFIAYENELIKLALLPQRLAGKPLRCAKKDYDIYDSLLDEFGVGYSPSIRHYIIHYRNESWKTCKNKFLVSSNQARTSILEDRLFSIVSYVVEKRKTRHLDYEPVVEGITNYIKVNLGKESEKKKKLTLFYEGTIRKTCQDLHLRLGVTNKIYELVEAYPEYEKELDTRSLKWIIGSHICNHVETYHSDLYDKLVTALTSPKHSKTILERAFNN